MAKLSQKSSRSKKRRRDQENVEVTWDNVPTDIVVGFIRLAERLDGAVRFGRSRDRGVFSIGIYAGDEHFTEWIRDDSRRDAEFTRIRDEIFEDFEIKE